MLVIRDEMIRAFAASTHAGFVARTRAHLRQFFPETCIAMGDARLGQFIEYGVFKARAWGFSLEPDLVRYLGLAMVFGHGFDRDERQGWARHILMSNAPPDPTQRMNRLEQAAQAMLMQRTGQLL